MTAAINNALDPQAMTRLRADLKGGSRESACEVARQFESLFVQQMLKSMRAATPGDSLFGGNAENQYRDLFDRQLSLSVAQGRGMGLAGAIERQLLQSMGIADDAAKALDPALARYQANPVRRPSPAPEPVAPAPPPAPAVTAEEPAARPGGKGPVWDNPAQFVRQVWKAAEGVAERLGVPTQALVAQAALETGWGQHVIRDGEGRPSFNLFGIKAHRDWDGATVNVPTLEYRDGVARREHASFRAYESLEQCFEDYARFLQGNPRYAQALQAQGDGRAFVEGLQQAGYATDPRYAEKIHRIMDGEILRDAQAPRNAADTI